MGFLKITVLFCFVASLSCQNSSTETDYPGISTSTSDLEIVSSNYTHETVVVDDDNITEDTTREDKFSTSYNDTSRFETTEQSIENVTTEEISWSPCSQKPCKNDATCHDDSSDLLSYNCSCLSSYTGKLCEMKDECYSNKNGDICYQGACIYDQLLSTRLCECLHDTYWDEAQKECRVAERPCFPNPCQNKGTCKPFKNGMYDCDCAPGFEGINCMIENKCGHEDDCGNGTCILNEGSNLKFCTCPNGFYFHDTSRQCEEIEPPCVPNPCKNNGVCEVISSEKHNCSCIGHYTGPSCEIFEPCYSTENGILCGGNGECVLNVGCVCENGYYLDNETYTCRENKKPCFPNPCHGHGVCIPHNSDNFTCSCSEGFTGAHCSEPDLCVFQGGNTKCGVASCVSSLREGTFYCSCEKGYFFDYDKKTCEKIDYCPLMKCQQNEECAESQCICKENYKWNNETNRCEANFCQSNPCPNDEMKCFEGNGINDYYCSCKEGFSFIGDGCVEAICIFPDFNKCEQYCETDEDGISCSCYDDQFTLNDDNITCIYEGNFTCVNKTCEKGSCLKVNDGEMCICPPGFIEIEGNCLDLCRAGQLPDGYCPDNKCESTGSGFRCQCEGKYILSKDKVTCTARRLCDEGEIGWKYCTSNNAECIEDWDSEKGFECKCIFPQVMSNEGACYDICSLEINQRECSDLGAICDVNTKGTKICKCPPLYDKFTETDICDKQADFAYLLTIPVDLNSYKLKHFNDFRMKRSLGQDSSADYFQIKMDIEKSISKLFPEVIFVDIINCRAHYTYYICKIELQFRSVVEEELQRIKSPETCVSDETISPDACLIPPSLILNKSRLKNILNINKPDPCEEDFKENLCGSETTCINIKRNSLHYFQCICSEGYVARDKKYPFEHSDSLVEFCNDVDECSDQNSCPLFTTCHNTMGSYTCNCISGYRMRNKSSDPKLFGCVEICDPNPCDHGTCEEKGDHEFECRCDAGYAGALCDLSDSNFKKIRTNTIIVGAVLGGALLVLFIIFISTVSRLKKKKTLKENDRFAAEMAERRGGAAVNNAFQRE